MTAKKRKWIFVCLASLLITLAACGSEEELGSNNGISGSSDSGPAADAGDALTPDVSDADDMSDATGEDASDAAPGGDDAEQGDAQGDDAGEDAEPGPCPDTPCPGGQVCVDNACVELTRETQCQAATDLGELTTGSTLTAAGDLGEGNNALEATCGTGEASAVEQVFMFQVAEDSKIEFTPDWKSGQFFGVVSFRHGECVSQDAEVECSSGDEPVYATAGETIYMIVEAAGGVPGAFEIALDATAESCPAGQRSCNGDVLQICAGEGQSNDYQCAGACSNGDCAGNVCSNPIDVTAATTFSGDLGGYDSTVNFENNSLCETESGTAVPTAGSDLFFRFPGLTAGQRIAIDVATPDTNNNAIFIGQDCAAPMACLQAQVTPETMEWSVPADGDYYVVVDALNLGDAAFQYSFDILPAP